MKSAERQQAIKILQQKADLYEQLKAAGSISKSDLISYHQTLTDLEKLQRIEGGFRSIMFFAKTYFSGSGQADLLQDHTPSPDFHYELGDILREAAVNEWGGKFALAAARSHSKSTIVSNIFLCWVTVYAEDIGRYYWILIGDKQATAASQLAVVKGAFEENERLRADFGDLTSRDWNQLNIITANGVRLQAAGSGEALRGLRHGAARPCLVLDDAEGEDNVSTPEAIAKTLAWFDMTVSNLGDPRRSVYFVIGTILHYQSMLATLINTRPEWKSRLYPALKKYPERMDLWERWQKIYQDRTEGKDPADATQIAGRKAQEFYETNKAEMDRGAEVLWPERMPLYEIMRQRATNPYAFSTELQCNPVDSEVQVFKTYHTYDLKDIDMSQLEILCGVDPSLKETKRSDPSAIVTVAKDPKRGLYYVLDTDGRRRSPDKIIEDLLLKTKIWKYKWVTVESIAFQAFFAQEVRKRVAAAGVYLDIREFKSTVKKEIRITALEPLISNGYIKFLPTQLNILEELIHYPRVRHEDLLDCLAQIIEQDQKKGGRGVIARI